MFFGLFNPDLKTKILLGLIVIIVIAIAIIIVTRPAPTPEETLYENPEKISTEFQLLTARLTGRCEFNQLIKGEFLDSAQMNCTFVNGTLTTQGQNYYFEGKITKANFTGTLSGKSQDNAFLGKLDGTLEQATLIGNAKRQVMKEPPEQFNPANLLPSWLIVIIIIAIILIVGGWWYHDKNKGGPIGGKKWKREDFVPKAKEHLLNAGMMGVTDEFGFIIDNNETPTQLFRIMDPPHLRDRVYEVFETPEGLQHRQVTENTIQELKELPRSAKYEQAMRAELDRRRMEEKYKKKKK